MHCAQTPEREVIVGGGGKPISVMGQHAPQLADKAMGTQAFIGQQKSERPAHHEGEALYAPTFGLQECGRYEGHVREASRYTKAALHPLAVGTLVTGIGLLIAALVNRGSSSSGKRR